jgi:hypothetical protein
MLRNNYRCRRARFESLEKKNLLAGDVLVNVVDGALNIEGDAADNQIAITAGAEAGSYVITGLEGTILLPVDPVTDLPGAPVSTLTVTDVHGRANIDLGEGDDLVALFDAEFRGKLKIETGDGDDRVLIGAQGDVGSELNEILSDELNVEVKGKLSIDTGLGDDEIEVGDASIYGHIKVNAGDGADLVSLGDATAVDGALDSLLSDLQDATLKVHGAIDANLGEGDDQLAMTQVSVRGSAYVDSGLGDDDLDIRLSHLSHLVIDAGEGADDVEVVDSVFAALNVKLGDGDDLLATANLRAKLAIISGDAGEDTLNELADSQIVHRIVRGIEVPPLDDVHIVRHLGGLPFFGRGGFFGINRLLGRLFC